MDPMAMIAVAVLVPFLLVSRPDHDVEQRGARKVTPWTF